MAAPDSAWVQALAAGTDLVVASTRGGLADDDTDDIEIPAVIVQRDGGGDLTRFTDNPLVFVNVLARTRAEADAMAKTVDDWFRWSLPTNWGGVSLRFRRCVSAFSEIGDENTSGVVNYAATYDCVTH